MEAVPAEIHEDGAGVVAPAQAIELIPVPAQQLTVLNVVRVAETATAMGVTGASEGIPDVTSKVTFGRVLPVEARIAKYLIFKIRAQTKRTLLNGIDPGHRQYARSQELIGGEADVGNLL
jgi:hypothetical protein